MSTAEMLANVTAETDEIVSDVETMLHLSPIETMTLSQLLAIDPLDRTQAEQDAIDLLYEMKMDADIDSYIEDAREQ